MQDETKYNPALSIGWVDEKKGIYKIEDPSSFFGMRKSPKLLFPIITENKLRELILIPLDHDAKLARMPNFNSDDPNATVDFRWFFFETGQIGSENLFMLANAIACNESLIKFSSTDSDVEALLKESIPQIRGYLLRNRTQALKTILAKAKTAIESHDHELAKSELTEAQYILDIARTCLWNNSPEDYEKNYSSFEEDLEKLVSSDLLCSVERLQNNINVIDLELHKALKVLLPLRKRQPKIAELISRTLLLTECELLPFLTPNHPHEKYWLVLLMLEGAENNAEIKMLRRQAFYNAIHFARNPDAANDSCIQANPDEGEEFNFERAVFYCELVKLFPNCAPSADDKTAFELIRNALPKTHKLAKYEASKNLPGTNNLFVVQRSHILTRLERWLDDPKHIEMLNAVEKQSQLMAALLLQRAPAKTAEERPKAAQTFFGAK